MLVKIGDQSFGIAGVRPGGQLFQQPTEMQFAIVQGRSSLMYLIDLFWYWLPHSYPAAFISHIAELTSEAVAEYHPFGNATAVTEHIFEILSSRMFSETEYPRHPMIGNCSYDSRSSLIRLRGELGKGYKAYV
ncbi:MAG: hypothetical protein M3Q62_03890 [Actinomycetota bacterium]|nr:hypothetical protein [Actinomycetota bacterium]